MQRIVFSTLMLAAASMVNGGSSTDPYAISLRVLHSGIPPAASWGERGVVVADVDADGRLDLLASGEHGLALIGVLGAPSGTPFGVRQTVPMFQRGAIQSGNGAVAWCEPRPPRLGAAVHIAYGTQVEVLTGWPLAPAVRYVTAGVVSGAVCADVDGDGADDLVVAEFFSGSSRVAAYDPWTGAFRWAVAGFNGGLRAAQLDADPALEIVAGTQIIDGATRAVEATYAPGFGLWTALGNLDAGPEPELLAADFGSTVTGFQTSPFSPTWSFVVSGGAGGIEIADVFAGGRPEIVVAARQGGLQIRDAATRQIVASYAVPAGSSGSEHPRAADFDGNGLLEVAWATGNQSSANDALAVVEPGGDATVRAIAGTNGPFWTSGPVLTGVGASVRMIIAGTDNPTTSGSVMWLASADRLELRSSIDFPAFQAFDVEAINLTPDAGDELVVAGLRAGSGEVQALRPDGTEVWLAGGGVEAFGSRRVVRVMRVPNAAGAPDDVLAIAEPESTGSSGTVAVLLRGTDGSPAWTSIAMGSGFSSIAGARVDEFDGDPQPELLLATGEICWVFDLGTRLLDASFPCADESIRVRSIAGGARQLVGFDAKGNIVLRALPSLQVVANWNVGDGLRALAPVPPFSSVFLYSRIGETGAINLDSGQILSSDPIDLGPQTGLLDRVRATGTDALGSTLTIGSLTGVFDVRVANDGLFRDGFEEQPPAR